MADPPGRRDAPALRFLLLCLGGWTLLRVMMNWSPAVPASIEMTEAASGVPSLPMVRVPAAVPPGTTQAAARRPVPVLPRRRTVLSVVRRGADVQGVRESGMAASRTTVTLPEMTAAAAPPMALPVTVLSPAPGRDALAGWSLGSWLYLRGGSGAVPGAMAAGGGLGGSQAGVRLAYGFGAAGRMRAYGRATVALHRPQQRELALGAAHAPVPDAPFDIAVERRVAVGREGRDAFAALVAGGVSETPLPAGFHLDAYAQAGVIGVRRRDGFADGAVAIDRPLKSGALRFGAFAAGAAQPGVARIDVGPRATLGLPRVGKGARVALDWRQRVAGGARPGSGLALMLAADF